MVKKSIGVTLLLLVLYGAFIAFCRIKPVGQSQSQDNVIRAENYIYNDSAKNMDVIVGTSLSAGIRMDMMPKGIYLLALPGQSVYDAMALIENTGAHPKYVFVEQNSLISEEHPTFIKYLFNTPNYYRKKYLPFMRDDYQPAGEFYRVVSLHATGATRRFTKYIFNPIVRVFHHGKTQMVDRDEFYAEAKQRRQKVDTEMVKASFERLKYWVNTLQKNGTKVCFYGVPNDTAVYNSKISRTIRNYYPLYFPPATYTYVPPPSIEGYKTVDQIHLDSVSWIRFTGDFAAKVKTIRGDNN